MLVEPPPGGSSFSGGVMGEIKNSEGTVIASYTTVPTHAGNRSTFTLAGSKEE